MSTFSLFHISFPLYHSLPRRFGTRDDELAVLANALSAHYAHEGVEGKLRAEWFLQRVADFDIANAAQETAASTTMMMVPPGGDRSTRLRQLYRDAALIPYRLSTLEEETRTAEQVGLTRVIDTCVVQAVLFVLHCLMYV